MTIDFLPYHRHFIIGLTACFLSFCAWAFLAQLDVVVTAQGKLVPTHFIQVAQPPEDGVVRNVLVKDGDDVIAGQALIELDAVFAEEDTTAAASQVEHLKLRLQRIDAELEGKPLLVHEPNVMAEYASRRQAQVSLMEDALRQYERSQAELDAAKERVRKYQELSPVAARQADMLERLRKSGFVSEAALNEKLIARIDTEREGAIQVRAMEAAEASLRQSASLIEKTRAEYRRQLSVERTDATQRLVQAETELKKQTHRSQLQVLRAPVAGKVTGLSVFTAGQVVQSGTTLLSLVPANDPLRFEGWIRNEDSALAFPGMAAHVKLAAYPFQKYGWLEGELSWLGVNAETPDAMRNAQGEPLFYRVRIDLTTQTLLKDGHKLQLKPGMQATVDLLVGTRTLFEYLTSPLRKIALEAAHEK